MNAWNDKTLIVDFFIKLALKWGYEKTKNTGILKYHNNVFDREIKTSEGIFYERIYIKDKNITYQKFINKDFTEIVDYVSCSAKYINNSKDFINYIF